ncbi:MAG: response regulator [Spirochaetes bacterium]|nr:response regulator [Spirochaetota bacterium]
MSKKKILIVDDVPTNIKILNDLLKDNYKVSAATNGEDALTIAKSENPPDLILLDIMMPEMDGYEVCSRLKKDEKTNKIPVIFVSTKDEIDDKLDGYESGGINYITKPIDPDFLIKTVEEAI